MNLDTLLAIEAIKQLKARYFRLADTKQWEAWGALFTEDAVFTVDGSVAPATPSEPVAIGRQSIIGLGSNRLATAVSVHHGHMPEIDILSPREARGVWAMEDIIETPEQRRYGYGHYHETYRFEDGAWRIATLHITRLRLVTEPLPGP